MLISSAVCTAFHGCSAAGLRAGVLACFCARVARPKRCGGWLGRDGLGHAGGVPATTATETLVQCSPGWEARCSRLDGIRCQEARGRAWKSCADCRAASLLCVGTEVFGRPQWRPQPVPAVEVLHGSQEIPPAAAAVQLRPSSALSAVERSSPISVGAPRVPHVPTPVPVPVPERQLLMVPRLADDCWRRPPTEMPSTTASLGMTPGRRAEGSGTRGDLSRQVAAQEAEARVLWAQVEAKEAEVERLEDEALSVEQQLAEANRIIGTLSAKVDAASETRHAILEASARRTDSQIAASRRRLARMEWELADKDEEIVTLQQTMEAGYGRVDEQIRDLGVLNKSRRPQDTHTAALMQDESRAFRASILRMEERCAELRVAVRRRQERLDDLMTQESVCASSAQRTQQVWNEQRQRSAEENNVLEARIREESSRVAAKLPQARAYDQADSEASRLQVRLAALIAFTREVCSTLREQSAVEGSHTALEAAIEDLLRPLRADGASLPPVVRVSSSEFLIGSELVSCAFSEAGRVCVRESSGGLVPMGSFLANQRFVGVPPSAGSAAAREVAFSRGSRGSSSLQQPVCAPQGLPFLAALLPTYTLSRAS